ncbi:stimulus-sensing domain-containing protein [Maritalea mediterranea]|uniref:histidine kinase n=1 Tax=Maritalea mediterranea TaxID=2909667 RepID=A0ABS9E4S1_9HYPH|nr:stimulus-sensing domain-containing protein [Maritalea mediterranea]MCF4097192.1 sensor histidine kinase [Maritalea mediterranea]
MTLEKSAEQERERDEVVETQQSASQVEAKQNADPSPEVAANKPNPVLLTYRAARRWLSFTIFSSLTRRIVILNVVALAALVGAIINQTQWRSGLINAQVDSLRVQGEIIAGAIAASATVDSDVITLDPDKFLQLQGDAPLSSLSFFDPSLEFPINPERVAPLLRNLITPTGTRARIYDRNGLEILDSEDLYIQGEVLGTTPPAAQSKSFFLVEWVNRFFRMLAAREFPRYQEYGTTEGTKYPEVASAMSGAAASIVRVDQNDRLVVSVAVPVKRLRANVGVLLLSTQPGTIDTIVEKERWNVVRIFMIAATITTLVSLLLASTIAGPMRRLSAAAQRVRRSIKDREEIPDFTQRPDEIGLLSGSLRDMTNALYNRIEAIESFAADVAHELKNPLTSLRSAVETLPLAKKDEDRTRLANIIQHDVRRLDRLISDISNASRLDAELARETADRVNLLSLTQTILSIQEDNAAKRDVAIKLENNLAGETCEVVGHDSRLAQVVTNLVDNAVSFSPKGATVTVQLNMDDHWVILKVRDEGRGIEGNTEKVFQRFYTDRPEGESFGDHSGLGLSISKQIVEAHLGEINARNRNDRSGAEFIVKLPRAE